MSVNKTYTIQVRRFVGRSTGTTGTTWTHVVDHNMHHTNGLWLKTSSGTEVFIPWAQVLEVVVKP